jgi:hypothetical protein
MTSCGNNALESLVVAAHVGDRGDLWRDPIPPLVDFRVLLEASARQGAENSLNAARRSCWAGAYAAAPRRTAPSSSMSEPDCPGAVVGAERPSGRCLSLLGPRGPPQERAPQAPRCDREDGRDRKAEADRRRACEAAPGRRGPNTPTTLSSGPSDPHSSCSRAPASSRVHGELAPLELARGPAARRGRSRRLRGWLLSTTSTARLAADGQRRVMRPRTSGTAHDELGTASWSEGDLSAV